MPCSTRRSSAAAVAVAQATAASATSTSTTASPKCSVVGVVVTGSPPAPPSITSGTAQKDDYVSSMHVDCSVWDDKDLLFNDYVDDDDDDDDVASNQAVVSVSEHDYCVGEDDIDTTVQPVAGTGNENENVKIVLEQWKQQVSHHHGTTQQPTIQEEDGGCAEENNLLLDDIMEVDEQIGMNFLGDEIFGGVGAVVGLGGDNTSSSFALDDFEFNTIEVMDEDDDFDPSILVSSSNEEPTCPSSPTTVVTTSIDQKQLTKLQELMKRTEETRKSLSMVTSKTKKYLKNKKRSHSLSTTLSNVETSSTQIQNMLLDVVFCKSRSSSKTPAQLSMETN